MNIIHERFFLTIAALMYGWNQGFAATQYSMWVNGIRDVRIHDNVPYILEITDQMVQKYRELVPVQQVCGWCGDIVAGWTCNTCKPPKGVDQNA